MSSDASEYGSWKLYFHDPDSSDWSRDSYVYICTVSTPNQFWGAHDRMIGSISRGMWFFMRGDVFPTWDDPQNISGGCMSYMVPKPGVDEAWASLCEKLMCGTVRSDGGKDPDEVNGASISPKNDFCILKIWLRSPALSAPGSMYSPSTGGIFSDYKTKLKSSA